MTHAELVEVAARWLRSQRCKPVFTEINCWATSESPDAFGVNSKGSIVVECKASVSDFYADRRKEFRLDPAKGMGRLRYYLCPFGLISPDRLTLADGWGLLWVNNKGRVYVKKESNEFTQASNDECLLMRSAWLWGRDGESPRRPKCSVCKTAIEKEAP